MPLFSIIIPAYNAEKYLKECLDSLICQSFEDFEVLVVNDGSIDRTEIIGSEYETRDPRFRLYNKENGGVSSARNVGLDVARGEWIVFLDADDMLTDEALSEIYRAINCDKNINLVIWGWQVFGESVSNKDYIYDSIPKLVDCNYIRRGLFVTNPYLGYSCMKAYRRTYVGHLRFHEDINYNEDRLFVFEYLTKISVRSLCCNIKKSMYLYRQHNESAMSGFSGLVTMKLLTDLEAFQRMSVIAQERRETELLYMISRCAWYNIMGMRNHLKGVDDDVLAKFNELSSVLLSLVPFYKRCIWNARYSVGKILRRLGIRESI